MNQPPVDRNAAQRTQTFCLVCLTTIASGFALYYLQSVVLPFVIALFIVIGVRPILEYLGRRLGLHWFLAFVLTFIVGVLLLAGFAFITWLSINDLGKHSNAYRDRIDTIVNWVSERIPKSDDTTTSDTPSTTPKTEEPTNDITDGGGSDEKSVQQSIEDLSEQSSKAMQELFNYLNKFAQDVLLNLAGSLSSLLSYAVLILIFVFFLLLGRSDATTNQPQLVRSIEEQIRKYLVMKTLISILNGMVTTIILWIFGVPLAVVFGFLAFLLNFIPNIGPLISNLLPVPFLLLNSAMSPWAAITCFVLLAANQFISGNVIETRIMGKSFDVSPVVLLLALMFFGLIWGIVGMFLATPIVSIIKIVLQQNRMTRPVGELMAGRWEPPDSPSATA